MKHCLTFATLTFVTGCKVPLFVAGCTVTLVSLKMVHFYQYRSGRSNHGCRIVGSSTREELTTEAASSYLAIKPLTGDDYRMSVCPGWSA